MQTMAREHVLQMAKAKFGPVKGFDLERAKGLVENEGRMLSIPPTSLPARTLKECEEGVVLGKLHIDYASDARKNGTFDVKVMKDHGVWVAQFVRDGQVEFATTEVWAEELPEQGPQRPVVTMYAFSPFALVFLGGVLYFAILASCAFR